MNYVAFDIETAHLACDGEDWLQSRPLGISCYALAWREPKGVKSETRYGKDDAGMPQPRMSRVECQTLVQQLSAHVAQGFTLLTWNGLGTTPCPNRRE